VHGGSGGGQRRGAGGGASWQSFRGTWYGHTCFGPPEAGEAVYLRRMCSTRPVALSLTALACFCVVPGWSLVSGPTQTTARHRAVLATPGGELVFTLLTILGRPVVLENGSESIPIELEQEGERYRVRVPPYESRLVLDVITRRGDSISATGNWTKRGAAGEQVLAARVEPWPHTVVEGRGVTGPAYPLAGEPLDLAGRWRVLFDGDPHPAVGVFEAVPGAPGEVRGTFLTTLGDYRYLAGTARGRELALSCFDGAHAFLFRAVLGDDGELAGDFWSGATWHQTWTATRDPAAALPDPFTLSRVVPGVRLAEVAVLGLDGSERRIGPDLGTATVVSLFGTWCPNCGDAAALLRALRDTYGARGLKVLGLAFEPGDDMEAKRERVADYARARDANWPIFLCGTPDKAAARAAFPVLDVIHAYPTTLFVDRDGEVRAVYSGFSGPATGAAHTELERTFRAQIERLLAE